MVGVKEVEELYNLINNQFSISLDEYSKLKEKAEKWDKSTNKDYEWIKKEEMQSYLKYKEKLEQENKQLKDKLERIQKIINGGAGSRDELTVIGEILDSTKGASSHD